MKALIVDDEQSSRILLQSILERWGYEVLEASNGEEGLAVLKERTGIDLALIDRKMSPGMRGEEVIRQIGLRQLKKRHPRMKVVLMSGGINETIREVALAVGADMVVEKPLEEKLLQELFPPKRKREKTKSHR